MTDVPNVPASSEQPADFPADGTYAVVMTDAGELSGWVAVSGIDRAMLAAEPDRRIPVALLNMTGAVSLLMQYPRDVQPRTAPNGAELTARELALLRAALSALTVERNAQAKQDARLDSLVEDAHEWADRHNLCSVFDDFMKSHGLPTRTREYEVQTAVTTEVLVSHYVRARSEDAARDAVGNMDWEKLRDLVWKELDGDRYAFSVEDYRIERVK